MTDIVSLFTGVGRLDVAARVMFNSNIIATAEIDGAANHVLRDLPGFETALHFSDVKTMPGIPCYVLTAGSPCQGFSIGNKKRAGLADERSGLFRHVIRMARECRPAWVLIENVPSARVPMLEVLNDELSHYKWGAVTLRASAVGAHHRRERVYILGSINGQIVDTLGHHPKEKYGTPLVPTPTATDWKPGDPNGRLARLSDCIAQQPERLERLTAECGIPYYVVGPRGGRRVNPKFTEWLMGMPPGWVTDKGLPWKDELRLIGNSVYADAAVEAIAALMA